jgi:hypothetical protein
MRYAPRNSVGSVTAGSPSITLTAFGGSKTLACNRSVVARVAGAFELSDVLEPPSAVCQKILSLDTVG